MSNFKRFLFATDLHGNHQNSEAVNKLFKFKSHWRPHCTIMGGDLFDFASIRRKASEEEKRQSMQDDFLCGKRFLERLQPQFYLRGNHCERLWMLRDNGQGIMQDYADGGIREIDKLVKSLRCEMRPYHKREGVVELGRLKFVHGFNSGQYAARQAAMVYSEVVMGHVHCSQTFSASGWPRPRLGMSSGCLSNVDFDYNRATMQSLAHNNGWIYGVWSPVTGNYECWHARKVDDSWIIPSDISICT